MSQAFAWLPISINRFELYHGFIEYIQNYTIEALEHLFLLSVFYVVLCILLYTGIRWSCITFTKELTDVGRVMIFIAHPDDECMFFGPTIVNLTKDPSRVVYLTCFSTGKNYGMGKIRKNELYSACKQLQIDEGCIIVQNHSLLPDSNSTKWPVDLLAKIIVHYVEVYNIDTIITFDKHGVSKHLNHCSLYYALAFLCIEHLLPKHCRIYTLESINIIRKYWLIFDIPLCFFLSTYRYIISSSEVNRVKSAMHQHKSQMLWYRKIYLMFSRYLLINTLEEMDPASVELDLTVDD